MLQQFIYSSIYWPYLFPDHLYPAMIWLTDGHFRIPVSLSACTQKDVTPSPQCLLTSAALVHTGYCLIAQSTTRNHKNSSTGSSARKNILERQPVASGMVKHHWAQLLQLPLSRLSVIINLFPGKGMHFSIHCYKTTTPLAGMPVAFSVQVEDKSYYMCCERECGEMIIRFKVRICFLLLICTKPTGRINNSELE